MQGKRENKSYINIIKKIYGKLDYFYGVIEGIFCFQELQGKYG